MTNDLQHLGRALLIGGLVLFAIGLVLTFAGKVPGLGRLPGDFVIRRGNFTLYLPLATCVILSVVLTLIVRLFRR